MFVSERRARDYVYDDFPLCLGVSVVILFISGEVALASYNHSFSRPPIMSGRRFSTQRWICLVL